MADKSIIKELESQVAALIADHKRLSALNAELEAQREKLLSERRELQKQVASQGSELSSLRLSQALSGSSADRDKARARVNQLMREVDRCIALLNKVDTEQEALNQ
ncbi:MAG: hypothetical protein SNF93_01100 [Rikenellaceae bacterium]